MAADGYIGTCSICPSIDSWPLTGWRMRRFGLGIAMTRAALYDTQKRSCKKKIEISSGLNGITYVSPLQVWGMP